MTNQKNAMTKYEMTIGQTIREIIKVADLGIPFYLAGAPGLGKTAAAKAVAKHFNLPYEEIRVAEFESVDFRGGMYLNDETKMAEWFKANIIPEHKCVLCFDELSQAPADLCSPLLKLIQEGKLGLSKLHPETIIIATGNRVLDRTGSVRLASALRERFVQVTIKASAVEWLKWYKQQPGFSPIVADYVAANPDVIHSWEPKHEWNQPSPRNWERIGELLKRTKNKNIIAGSLGPNHTPNFMQFALQHPALNPTTKPAELGIVPDPVAVVKGKAKAPDKTDPMMSGPWADAIVAALVDKKLTGAKAAKLVEATMTPSAIVEFLRKAKKTDYNIVRRAGLYRLAQQYRGN